MQELLLPTGNRLPRESLKGSPRKMARDLLGKVLIRQLPSGDQLRGIIVETEAYLASGDSACHSVRGMTPKNRSIFGPPGTLYVYPIHSRHCMNIVTEREGVGSAVLIRALEPIAGLFHMAAARKAPFESPDGRAWVKWIRHLTSGPGRVCEALCVDRDLDGVDLCNSTEMWLEELPQPLRRVRFKVTRSPRIGVTSAHNYLLRYFIDGHQCVSGRAADHRQGRHWTFVEHARQSIIGRSCAVTCED